MANAGRGEPMGRRLAFIASELVRPYGESTAATGDPATAPDERAKDEWVRRVTDTPLALAPGDRAARLDLLAIRAQDRGPGLVLSLVHGTGRQRQRQVDHV